MLSLSLFFMELMYPQDDEIGVLEVLEIKILFAAQPWWTDLGFSPQVLHWCLYKVIEKR